MKTPLIFLDIDGVLNNHAALRDGINSIDRQNMEQLNILVRATGAKIVISSAWRYMILGGAMTIDGFRYMLMTHGLTSEAKIIGHTVSDEQVSERGEQIREYLHVFFNRGAAPQYVVLDDGSEEPQAGRPTLSASLRGHGHRWILVDGERGLSAPDVERAVAVLEGRIRPSNGGIE